MPWHTWPTHWVRHCSAARNPNLGAKGPRRQVCMGDYKHDWVMIFTCVAVTVLSWWIEASVLASFSLSASPAVGGFCGAMSRYLCLRFIDAAFCQFLVI